MADVNAATTRNNGELTPQPTKQKKVRLACQRCRDRRIKCDGQTPSCSKCAKAGVRCIDVNAHANGSSIPRAFLADAQARLEWLEEIVRTQLPNVDLGAGPQNPDPQVPHERTETYLDLSRQSPANVIPEATAADQMTSTRGEKRATDTMPNQNSASIPKRARRMAADIGLFSLNQNAAQAQYLGSSSGSFFADLLRSELPASRSGEVVGISESDSESEAGDDTGDETHHVRQGGQSLLKSLKELLPPRQKCDRMIRLFFTFYHADYPILHQPSFLALVDALYASADCPADSPLQPNGWPTSVAAFRYNDETTVMPGKQEATPIHFSTGVAHLCMVLGIAANLQTRKRVFTLDPKPFATQALASLQTSLAQVSLSSIQSMVLFVLHSFLSSDGGRIWIMLHVAMSYAIDLGLQRNHPDSARFSSTVLQMRRRIFLTLYTLERFVSTVQGRPIGFEDHTLDLTPPAVIPNSEETESSKCDQAFLPYSVSHFQWASIVSELKRRFYRLLPGNDPPETIRDIQHQLQQHLERWLGESLLFVETLHANEQTRFRTKLRIDFYFAIGLLYQPSRICPRPDLDALRQCFESAKQRIRLFDSLYYQNNLSLSWPRTHGVFLAGATYIYCIWTSADIRSTAAISEVASDLRSCSSLLALGGEWWPLAQKGKRSFERLADSTLQSLMSRSSSSAAPLPQLPHSTTAASQGQYPEPFAMGDHEWLDVENVLQSFLQNDLQFPDLLETFDPSTVDPTDFCFDTTGWNDSNLGLPG